MTTPVWQPGTLYTPGSLVQPASAVPPTPTPVENGGFEDGNTDWSLGSGFSIGAFGSGTFFQGTHSLQWDLGGEGRAISTTVCPVTPGQVIKANCQVQQGASSSGEAGARAEVAWYDASDDLITYTAGNLIDSGSNQHWKQSSVTATAPAGAAFARFSVYAFRNSGSDELWVDNCVWDATNATFPTGLVFRAVQDLAGSSGSTEPVWPTVNGQTVVDNEVTWEAVFASRVVWEASPILTSGPYEPDWPTIPNGTVADGTIKWVAMPARVTDEKCPNSKIGVAGASKIFAADEDIIPFCATTNPLDWSSEQDAGYLPFGLNTYGSTPVEAMGLYRANLVAFNSSGYQMWQIDEDPANMALLDASPVDCVYRKSVQAVMNDLAFLSSQGVRNIGIAGASTNLQAGSFGKQIDPLVLAKIQAGLEPISLFFPGAGQFWLIFDAEAFVLTINGEKDQNWSRYVFPQAITDWSILDGTLFLRAGTVVWEFSVEALEDDMVCDGPDATFVAGHVGEEFPAGLTGFSLCGVGPTGMGEIISSTFTTPSLAALYDNIDNNLVLYLYDSAGPPAPDVFAGFTVYNQYDEAIYTAELADGETTTDGNSRVWTFTDGPSLFTPGDEYRVVMSNGGDCAGAPFEGYIAWPYLDFRMFGLNKMLDSVDVTATGEYSLSIGYDQSNFALATTPYTVDGDTLPGTPIPIPVAGPSFQLRLTFSASQQWEWMASNMYLSNMRIP